MKSKFPAMKHMAAHSAVRAMTTGNEVVSYHTLIAAYHAFLIARLNSGRPGIAQAVFFSLVVFMILLLKRLVQ